MAGDVVLDPGGDEPEDGRGIRQQREPDVVALRLETTQAPRRCAHFCPASNKFMEMKAVILVQAYVSYLEALRE